MTIKQQKLIENYIRKVVRKTLNEAPDNWGSNDEEGKLLIQDLESQIKTCYNNILKFKQRMKSINDPADEWLKDEYQYQISENTDMIRELGEKISGIKRQMA